MKNQIKAPLVAGAGAAAIAAALSGAGSANASCASINGHGIGKGCTSDVGSASIALGHDALADSAGPGTVAVAVGNPGFNPAYKTNLPTHASATGAFSSSVALGNGSNAGTLGTGNFAGVLGQGSNAFSYGGNAGDPLKPFAGNHDTSVTVGNGGESGAVGKNHKLSTAFGNGLQQQNNGLKP